MKIPAFKRIIVEDFDSKYQDLVSKLAYSINSFTDTITIALNSNLSINDNFTQIQKKVTVTVNSSGTVTSGGTIVTGLTGLCGGAQVILAVNNNNASLPPTSAPFLTFTNGNGTIVISNITGLKANNSYTLTIILYPSV